MTERRRIGQAVIGEGQPRIDGPLKVSGRAMYTSDHHFPGMLYAVPVGSTIAKGAIRGLDTAAAERMPGVRAVFYHRNFGKLFRSVENFSAGAEMAHTDESRPPLEDDIIRYYGQYVALVVADTFEQATAAADAVKVTYSRETPNVSPNLSADMPGPSGRGPGIIPQGESREKTMIESQRGEPERAFAAAPVTIDQAYVVPTETHNPIELHATVALWDGNSFTLYESTQGVVNQRNVMAQILGVPKENVRIVSKFLGSGFGGKLFPWPHSALAAQAARQLGKPVKLVVSRRMMFQNVGQRPRLKQRIRLGATPDGKLMSLEQYYVNSTSIGDNYQEHCGEATPYLYSVPNLRVKSALAKRNIGSPTPMRGPGAVPGLYATESAMDELAIKLKMDPVQLRLANEPEIDEGLKIPFSSRHFKECLTTGVEKFGWSRRTPDVGSMQRDGRTIGWGVAGCSWIAQRFACRATVELRDDGTACVACGTQDIGTGTYTILAMLAGEKLGLPAEKVEVVLGDSRLPPGPLSGGSMVTASVTPAVLQATRNAIGELLKVAMKSPTFAGRRQSELGYADGKVRMKGGAASDGVPYGEILKSANVRAVTGLGASTATFDKKPKVSMHSYGAQFAEVTWQPEIARLRVSRVVSVMDGGRIINPLAGRNQIAGAVVMGIGMCLLEETTYDPRSGAPINSNLADYLVASNADVASIDVHFLDYPDRDLDEVGARGIGEIGLAGTAAAIGNAVYHATGVRVRELPIRIEDLIG